MSTVYILKDIPTVLFVSCVLPILSGLNSLNDTVEVPSPPDLVVTMISPLSSLAGPTRHTILLADIHSAVSRQLWPQMDRPDRTKQGSLKKCQVKSMTNVIQYRQYRKTFNTHR